MPGRLSGFWGELVACHDDLTRLLELIARRAAEVVGEACVLTTVSDEGDELVPVAVYHADPEVSRFIRTVLGAAPYPVGEGLAGTVVSRRQRVVLSDLSSAELGSMFAPHAAPFLERFAIRAVLIVPLITFGEVVGTLGVVRLASNDPYGDDDIMMLEALAERAALALVGATRTPAHVGQGEYEAIFQQSVDGILVTVPDGHVLARTRPLAPYSSARRPRSAASVGAAWSSPTIRGRMRQSRSARSPAASEPRCRWCAATARSSPPTFRRRSSLAATVCCEHP